MPNSDRKIKKAKYCKLKQSAILNYMSQHTATPTAPNNPAKQRTPPSVENNITSKKRTMADDSELMDQTIETDGDNKFENMPDITESNEDHTELKIPVINIPIEKEKDMTIEERMISMETRILETLKSCLLPIHHELRSLQTSLDDNMEKIKINSTEVNQLKETTKNLNRDCERLKKENHSLQEQLNRIENKQLENNVIFQGIPEDENELASNRLEWIYHILADLVNHHDHRIRLDTAKEASIEGTMRLGPYSRNKTRPVQVTFTNRFDVEWLFQNKKRLRAGIYCDQAYCPDTENKRRILRPIWKAAKNHNSFRGKCRMDGDYLVLNGRKCGVGDIPFLPPDLSGYTVTSKSDRTSIGFFGELNPFSNFHSCYFDLNGKTYHSTEQFIQYTKAIHFRDNETAERILRARTPLDCKKESRNINYNGMDSSSWQQVAKSRCKPGIKAKFDQNRTLMTILLNTGRKRLVECSYDRLWGSGVPLHCHDSLQTSTQTGILGEILMEVRDECFLPNNINETLV